MKRRAICAARASSPRQRLQGEFEPHGVNDFEQRVRAGCALAREAFVQTFTRQARIARQLGHATGAGNVAQCACQLRGVDPAGDKLLHFYAQRLQERRVLPYDPDWDGATHFDTK